ncbi:hypothetical protein PENTCL1PPCAC_4352, partial [Pristionchus entomophagus]
LVLADPITRTEYGDVIGFAHNEADIYLGIPFAAPPVGHLRFRPPVAPEPWTTPRLAQSWSDACVPHSRAAVTWRASEDCLYLNVIAPKRQVPNFVASAPVLFFIHGGGFEIGHAKRTGYEEFADVYAKQGVVVVSIQYRIGVLGFFTNTASDSITGNYGMLDQVAALKFVHRNIENFGGDPNRITVFGISAGGCAASMLTLSPLSRDLIVSSIEMSGTAHAGWSNDNRVEAHSNDLVDAICGCTGFRPIEVIDACMRNVSVDALYEGVQHISEAAFALNMFKFAPRIDGIFATDRYEDLARNAPKIPVLTGINALESAFFTLMNLSPTIHRTAILKEEMSLFNADQFRMKVRILLDEFLEPFETDAATDDILNFYLGPDCREKYAGPNKEQRTWMLQQYSHFWGDVYFNLPARYRANERKEIGAHSYVYLWEHYNSGIFKEDDPVHASVHINEMPYIVGLQALGEFEWTPEERKLRERARQMMISFIKNGKPSVDGVDWPSFTANSNAPFVRIASPQWITDEGFLEANLRFWTDVMSKYSYDFVRFKKQTV